MPQFESPLTITWDLTYACNLKCIHCAVAAGKPLSSELSTGECKQILNMLKDEGIFKIGFSGGELFMRKDFLEILNLASKMDFAIEIASNSFSVDKPLVEKLKDIGVSAVQYSVDGLEKTHDGIRGIDGAFSKTMEAIKLSIEEGIPIVAVVTVAMKPNLRDVPRLAELCSELGVDQYIVVRLKPLGRADPSVALQLSLEEYENLMHTLEDSQREIRDTKIQLAGGCVFFPGKTYAPCPAGRTALTITPSGDVNPCTFLPLKLGNLKKQSLREIWHNSPFIKYVNSPENLKGKCKSCRHRETCGRCLSMSYFYNKDPMAPDPMCWL